MENSKIFNRVLARKRRNRSAANWPEYNFLKQAAAERLADCLLDIARDFPMVLDIGCHGQEVAQLLPNSYCVSTDSAELMHPTLVCDEEFLPFSSNNFDLVTSVLSLHHVNDLVGSLIQIKQCLKEDGLFIAVAAGANTLIELRNAVLAVSAEQHFPLSPRVSPFVEVRDAGALLQRAGFALPVVNSEIVTVQYESAWKLMQDIKGQGETTILNAQHQGFTPKSQIQAICQYYDTHFRDDEGFVTASVEFITMTGWKPHSSQQMPAKRGSGQVNLRSVLE